MKSIANRIAAALLEIKAVKLNVNQPFTWASGWKSPIYCDNRKILSFPEVRKLIYQSFAQEIRTNYPEAEVIAGVATGAIAHGVLVAEELGLPFVYVRAAPKGHGLENLIEGELPANAKVVVIEDLISTGGSSIAAVQALRAAHANVLGLLAIFSYNFDEACHNFQKANCHLSTLSNYTVLVKEALEIGAIQPAEINALEKWRDSPEQYGK